MENQSAYAWLGLGFLNITFSIQEDDPLVDVFEIRHLLDENDEGLGRETKLS